MGVICISNPLIGDNHPTCVRVVTDAFYAKNKLHFVDGTLPKHLADSLDVHAWEKFNFMAF